MAATVVVIRDKDKWAIIDEVLCELEQGGIIVPPETAAKLDAEHPDWEDSVGGHIEYDFGGEADTWVDIARGGNMAEQTLLDANEDEDDDFEDE